MTWTLATFQRASVSLKMATYHSKEIQMRSMFLRQTMVPFRLLERMWDSWEQAYREVLEEIAQEEEDRRHNRNEER